MVDILGERRRDFAWENERVFSLFVVVCGVHVKSLREEVSMVTGER